MKDIFLQSDLSPSAEAIRRSDLFQHLSDRWEIHNPRKLRTSDGLKEAAVLVALTQVNDEPWLLLTLRAQHMPTHKGEVAFPGGKAEASDSNIIETALREASEEVSLKPADVAVVGVLDQVTSLHGFLVTPVLAVIDHSLELAADPGELDCYFKVPLSLFKAPPADYFVRGKNRIPTFYFEEFRIWGLTSYVISEFMNRYFDTNIEMTNFY